MTLRVRSCAVAGFVAALLLSSAAQADMEAAKKLTFDRQKGNCLACHMIEGGNLAGNIGPPLLAIKERFPDKAVLREQIWDATIKNPNSLMPPFGSHGILSGDEIDQIVEFIYTL